MALNSRKYDEKRYQEFLREMGDTYLKEAIQDTNLLSNPEIMTPSLMDCYEHMMAGLNMGMLLSGHSGSGKVFTAQLMAAKAKAVFKVIGITYGTTVEDILRGVLGSLGRGEIVIFDGIECADEEIINFLDVILDPSIMLKCDKIDNDYFYKFKWKGTWYHLNTNSYIILINNLDIHWRNDIPATWKSRLMFETIPAETLGSFVTKMKTYDNAFSEKFYILLFMLVDYIEQAAKKFGFKFYPNIRYSQRFIRLIKSHLHYANFERAIIIEYVNYIFAGEDTYPDSFEQHLKEAMGFDIIMKHLYDTYLEDCKESEKKKVESAKAVAHVPTEISDEILRKVAARFGKPEKKEEEKKDMSIKIEIKENKTYNNVAEKNRFSEISLEEVNYIKPGVLKALQKEFGNIKTPKNGLPTVNRVCINKDTNMTMLQFSNGDSISVYRDPEDQEDLEKAVAIAMVKYAWGYLENEKAMKRVVNATKKPKNKKKPDELKPAFLAPHDELKKKKVARRKPVEEAPKEETPKKTTRRKPGPKKPKLQDVLDHLVESEH